jgi:translocation and assembly module TamB
MRRWLKIMLLGLAGLATLLATLPWWLGPSARPVARLFGVTFGTYERLGYAHFRVTDVRVDRPAATITVQEAGADTPVLWLWRRATGRETLITVGPWRVEAHPTGPRPGKPERVTGMPSLHTVLLRVGAGLRFWMPQAKLAEGTVTWPKGGLSLIRAEWQGATLTVHALKLYGRTLDGAVAADPTKFSAHVTDAATGAAARLEWVGPIIRGAVEYSAQPLKLSVSFPEKGWGPTEMLAESPQFDLPAESLKLGAQYSRVRGGGRFEWKKDHFDVVLHAKAEPKAGAPAPALEAKAEAHGDRRSITISALRVNTPFATADLTAPATLGYDGRLRGEPARLTVQADLARQPWFAAGGTVRGGVTVTTDRAQEFELESSGVQVRDFSLQQVNVRGVLRWPRLEISRFEAQLDDVNRASVKGALDLKTGELDGAVAEAQFDGTWFRRWLPAGAQWKKAVITADFSGSLRAPAHHGTAKATGARLAPWQQPLDLEAAWSGRGAVVDNFTAGATAGHSSLEAAGAVDARRLQLRKLNFAPEGAAAWRLEAPAILAWSPALRLENVRLRSAEGHLALGREDTPDGAWKIELANFDSAWLHDWVKLAGPAWRVRNLQAGGRLADGALVFNAQLSGQIALKPQPAQVSLTARGNAQGVHLEELKVLGDGRVLTQAGGHFPVVWDTHATPHLRVDDRAPFELQAHTESDSPLWAMLTELTGVALVNPTAHAQLTGTLREPRGELSMRAGRMAATRGELKDRMPDITELTLAARADRGELMLDSFAAKVDGQVISATGKLPLGADGWRELVRHPADYAWREGEGRVEIPDADLAPLARRVPEFVAAQGRLRAKVELKSGGDLSGELHLVNAATRPIDPLGVVQEIDADLALSGRTLEVRSWSGKIGGQPVVLQGTVALPPRGRPRLALNLKGENLPLVRRAGVLVRTNLDLHADTADSGVTRVSGTVTLRDCLVLADLATLLPGGPRTAQRQPPYFAVDTPPFRHWPLAVEVRGPRAVRIRTAVFTGTASPHFQLGGTLGEPRAVGDLTIDEGRVLFPFATFTVQYGAARLQEADPYHPQLNVNATAHFHDYELRMEATGPLESPNVALSSNPPLEAAQVLLMVTSGLSPETDAAARTGTQRLTRLGTFLGQGLFQDLGGEPSRLEISTGERVSQQGRETYEITYQLGERWALTGEYDEFDDYNVGLKWRAWKQEGSREKK